MLDLEYCEDIKPMTYAVHAPVVLFSLWSKLWTISWRKHSINSSSDSVSVNSIVDIIAYFSKSNIAEYDNERPNAHRTSTKTCDLVIWWTSKVARIRIIFFTFTAFLQTLCNLSTNGNEVFQIFLNDTTIRHRLQWTFKFDLICLCMEQHNRWSTLTRRES